MDLSEPVLLPFHFMRFYRDLRQQEQTLRYLTDQTWKEAQDRDNGVRTIPRPVTQRDGTTAYAPDAETWKVLAITADIDRHTLSANILGGAAILILEDLTQSLAFRLGVPRQARGTELIAGYPTGPGLNDVSVASLLNAASNNFRHYNEWARIPWPYTAELRSERKYAKAFKSIDVLRRALRVDGPLLTLRTGDALNRLSLGSYVHLEKQISRIPEDLAKDQPLLEAARLLGLQYLANLSQAAQPPSESHRAD